MTDNINKKQIKIFLAPMRGLTNKVFRQALSRYYFGIDTCITPFFSVTESSRDVFSRFEYQFSEDELNGTSKYNTIPQIIGKDPKAIAEITQMFSNNGFNKVNLNIGCPMPQITKRRRGSGLLPYPDMIDDILNEVFSSTDADFSVKIRLGKSDYNDIFKVVEGLNKYPLDFIVLHPRLADDRYEGAMNLDYADKAIELSQHKIIFNGDITDVESFEIIRERYPDIDSFMIGRGLLSDPALAEKIKGLGMCCTGTNSNIFSNMPPWFFKFNSYYNFLLDNVNSISQIKAYWLYFIKLFDNDKELYNKMVRANTKAEMRLDFLI